MSEKTPKRIFVIEAIREGGKTHSDLMDAAECNAAGLASQFTYMRLMGNDAEGGTCPIKDDAGIYSLVTGAEWEEMKAEKKASAKTRTAAPKDPVARLKAATKRVAKAEKADKSYAKKMEETEDASRELEIRAELAELNLELANLELDMAKVGCPDGIPEEVIEDDAVEETDEDGTDLE